MTTYAKPPKSLLRSVGRAIADYDMVRDGDRILLGVSGGKDSLSLLQILCHLRTCAPVRFDLGVITVDPEVEGFDPSSLTRYYDRLGVPWHYERQHDDDEDFHGRLLRRGWRRVYPGDLVGRSPC